MFQFSGFPSIHYGFMHGSQVLHLRGFPIRKSADRSLFAAPRSLSQLVTSFFGSWCQGIHLMLFLAWTSSFYSSLKIAFRFFCLSLANNWLGYHLLFWKDHFYYSPFLAHCSLPNLNRKDLNLSCMNFFIRLILLKSFLNYLFVSLLTLFGFQWTLFGLGSGLSFPVSYTPTNRGIPYR